MRIEDYGLSWEEMEEIYLYVAREKNKQWYKQNKERKKAYNKAKTEANKQAKKNS